MKEFVDGLSLKDVALIAGALVAVVGLILALLSPAGRDKVAALGLRVADALVGLIERLLSDPALVERLDTRIERDAERAGVIAKGLPATEQQPQEPEVGCIVSSGLTEAELEAAFARFAKERQEAEREIFKDVLWMMFCGDDEPAQEDAPGAAA